MLLEEQVANGKEVKGNIPCKRKSVNENTSDTTWLDAGRVQEGGRASVMERGAELGYKRSVDHNEICTLSCRHWGNESKPHFDRDLILNVRNLHLLRCSPRNGLRTSQVYTTSKDLMAQGRSY